MNSQHVSGGSNAVCVVLTELNLMLEIDLRDTIMLIRINTESGKIGKNCL